MPLGGCDHSKWSRAVVLQAVVSFAIIAAHASLYTLVGGSRADSKSWSEVDEPQLLLP